MLVGLTVGPGGVIFAREGDVKVGYRVCVVVEAGKKGLTVQGLLPQLRTTLRNPSPSWMKTITFLR